MNSTICPNCKGPTVDHATACPFCGRLYPTDDPPVIAVGSNAIAGLLAKLLPRDAAAEREFRQEYEADFVAPSPPDWGRPAVCETAVGSFRDHLAGRFHLRIHEYRVRCFSADAKGWSVQVSFIHPGTGANVVVLGQVTPDGKLDPRQPVDVRAW